MFWLSIVVYMVDMSSAAIFILQCHKFKHLELKSRKFLDDFVNYLSQYFQNLQLFLLRFFVIFYLFRLQEIEGEFEKHVSPSDVSKHHEVDPEGITAIYNYWVLKRRASHNKPLLAPRPDDVDFLSRQQEQADHEKMKMFVQLRQDLERVIIVFNFFSNSKF